jgi:hypothetical protein
MQADSSEAQKPQSQQLDSSRAAEGADDPRPVFAGDWNSASGAEKGAHSERVRQWKLRHPEAAPDHSADDDVAAIMAANRPKAGSAPDADLGLRTLRSVAADKSAPASARVTAASALRAAEAEAERTAAEDERARVTAALAAAPLPERLRLLERIVRRDEQPGWRSVFDAAGGD